MKPVSGVNLGVLAILLAFVCICGGGRFGSFAM